MVGVLGSLVITTSMTRIALTRVERGQTERLADLERRETARTQAEALLDEVAEWLRAAHAHEGRYPRGLRERPPADPWGNDLVYTSSGLDRAELRSCGPDGRPDTLDDLVRTLTPR